MGGNQAPNNQLNTLLLSNGVRKVHLGKRSVLAGMDGQYHQFRWSHSFWLFEKIHTVVIVCYAEDFNSSRWSSEDVES